MTAASNAEILASAEFRIGRVFSRSFGILRRHFFKFLLLTLIAMAPSLLLVLSGLSTVRPVGPQGVPQVSGTMIATGLGGVLLWVLLYAVSQAVVLHGAFQDMRGKPFVVGTSLKAGLSRLLPIIGLGISVVIAVDLGFILLVVPGFIIMSMLFVSLPACVVERLGPFKSMSRSAALTKGHRWQIFGIFLLLLIVLMIVGAIVGFIGGIVGAIVLSIGGPSHLIGITVTGIVNFVSNALAGAFQAIVVAVIYHDLRVVKEGVDADQIAAVFD
jgi:hypothetical protein